MSIRGRSSWTYVASWGFSIMAFGFLGIMTLLFIWQSLPIWGHEGLGLITGQNWFFRQQQFGALAMIYGAAAVSLVALILAVPVGIGSAIFVA